MNKADLRAKMRKYRPIANENWVIGLQNWSLLQAVSTVCCFLPLADEPDTRPLLYRLLELNKRVCVPKCLNDSGDMEAVLFLGEATASDARGIPTTEGEPVLSQAIDLMLVPGLAFDAKGNRLGRGKGYYDRFLTTSFSGITCGICPSMRFLSSLPTEPHDRAVDFVFTPYGLYKTKDE